MNVWQKKIIELEETIARIRAETAKNSGEVVKLDPDKSFMDLWIEQGCQTSTATPANSRAEAIRECIAVVEAMKETHSGIDDVTVRLRALLQKEVK